MRHLRCRGFIVSLKLSHPISVCLDKLKVTPLDEKHIVIGSMLRVFGAAVTEIRDVFRTNLVLEVGSGDICRLSRLLPFFKGAHKNFVKSLKAYVKQYLNVQN